MEYWNTKDEIYVDINDYNSNRSRRILIFFNGMIADMNPNIEFQSIVKELLFIII